MAKRIRSDQLTWLKKQADDWLADGTISATQHAEMIAKYEAESPVRAHLATPETQEQTATRRWRLAIYALVATGLALICLGAFLLVFWNWRDVPTGIWVLAILGVVGLTQASGFLLYTYGDQRQLGSLVLSAGSLLFGIGLMLGTSLQGHAFGPHLLFWWLLAVLPLALVLGRTPLHLAVMVGLWMLSSSLLGTADGKGLPSIYFQSAAALGSSLMFWAIPVMALTGLLLATRRRYTDVALAYLIPLMVWSLMVYYAHGRHLGIGAAVIGLFWLIAGSALRHETATRTVAVLGATCRCVGTVMVAWVFGLSLLMTLGAAAFDWTSREVLDHYMAGSRSLPLLLIPALIVIALHGAWRWQQNASPQALLLELVRRQLLPFGVMALTVAAATGYRSHAISVTAACMVIAGSLLVLALWLLFQDAEDAGSGDAALGQVLGVLLLLLWVVMAPQMSYSTGAPDARFGQFLRSLALLGPAACLLLMAGAVRGVQAPAAVIARLAGLLLVSLSTVGVIVGDSVTSLSVTSAKALPGMVPLTFLAIGTILGVHLYRQPREVLRQPEHLWRALGGFLFPVVLGGLMLVIHAAGSSSILHIAGVPLLCLLLLLLCLSPLLEDTVTHPSTGYGVLTLWYTPLWVLVTLLGTISMISSWVMLLQIAAMFMVVGRAHTRNPTIGGVYLHGGLAVAMACLIRVGSPGYFAYLQEPRWYQDFEVMGITNFRVLIMSVGLGLVCLGILAWEARRLARSGRDVPSLLRTLARDHGVALLSLALGAGLVGGFVVSDGGPGTAWVAGIAAPLANLVLLVSAVVYILHGATTEHFEYLGAGAAMLLVWSFTRYLQLIASRAGLTGGAIMFVVYGTCIILLAIYWWRQRRVRHA